MPADQDGVTGDATVPTPSASTLLGPARADLLFDRPFEPTVATNADLVFGASGDTAARNDLTLRANLPLPVLAASFIPLARAALVAALPGLVVPSVVLRPSLPLRLGLGLGLGLGSGTGMAVRLPGLVARVEVRYASHTQRPTVGRHAPRWQGAQPSAAGSTQSQQNATATPTGWDTAWQRGQTRPQGVQHRLPPVLSSLPAQRRTGQQRASGLYAATGFAHQDATPLGGIRPARFQNAGPLRDATRFAHQDGDRSRRTGRVSHWAVALQLAQLQAGSHAKASPSAKGWRGRYQDAVPPPPGLSVWVIPPPPPPPPAPPPCPNGRYRPSSHLQFAALAPADGQLLFLCDQHRNPPPPPDPNDDEPVLVPVRRVYFVINNVTLHRLPDGLPVPVFSLTLSLDAASWAWGFEAVLPAPAEALVAGVAAGPVELVASVNGTPFHVLAEHISRERVFGDASIRVSGRGHNAVLAAPYAPVMGFSNTEGRTARQLMDDVLTLNGVPLGWTVDWGLTDWIVPAGVFAQQGTWIEALAAIAGSAGGYLMPHPSDPIIRVRHRYPVAPWDWASVRPDFVLPVDAVARESLRWVHKPSYNRVFVAGQAVGVLGQVTRAGTAGDVLAPMVVDALITEAAAARQRGLAVLADTGPQIEVSLRLPVLAEIGIIEPGAFVEYRDGDQDSTIRRRGLVRSTQIDAGMPELWQTLGVQSHA